MRNVCRAEINDNIGCVPGPKGQIIRVQDALNKPWPKGPMKLEEIIPTSVTAGIAESVAAPA